MALGGWHEAQLWRRRVFFSSSVLEEGSSLKSKTIQAVKFKRNIQNIQLVAQVRSFNA